MRLLFLLTLLFSTGFAYSQNQPDETEINRRLTEIKQRLGTLKNQLNQAEGEESKLLKELEAQDQKINQQGKEIVTSQQQIDTAQQQIDQLSQQIERQNHSIADQKQQIIELLRLNIFLSHDRLLKTLLLNADSQAAEITGHQVKYLQNKLYRLIGKTAEQIILLQASRDELSKQQQQLLEQQQLLKQQQAAMIEQKQQRSLVLKQLQKSIKTYRNEQQGLNKNRQRLNTLLSEISRLLDDLPDDLGKNTIFSKLKGKMSKPASGKTIRSYRSLRAGHSRWDGIVIAENSGKPVQAVAYGRVAFADWLRGYGLLLIIEHGEDYLTLYGHNESILVEVGDWVQSGQTIATIGNSGSINPSGVYFEIRKQAKPTNPTLWFKKNRR